MSGRRGLFSDRPYSRQRSPERHEYQPRHHDVSPRGRHGEQRPLPRRPTGPFDQPPRREPSPPPVRQAMRRTTNRHMSRRDREFEDPTCNSNFSAVTEDEVPTWSWRSMIASVISMTLFGSVFGLIGLMFSSLAYSDHKVGDYRRSRFKSRLAWFFALFGITVTVFAITFLLIVMYAINVPRPTFRHNKYWVPPWLYDRLEDQ